MKTLENFQICSSVTLRTTNFGFFLLQVSHWINKLGNHFSEKKALVPVFPLLLEFVILKKLWS